MEKVESLTFFLQELLDRRIFRALCSSLKQGSSNSCETWSSSRAERKEAKELLLVELGEMMEEERPWYHEIEQYCRDGTFPEEAEA
ncbi:hypothetical protein Taro_011028 [Colocasia esculenta]|uniref:Uncharacterized protein n=1 Tax=Colocasia esculenta TaxID=4460 RepID=A0A843U9H5_COLES|nr:hypothetical protein [Colocasia esculenta]